MTCFRPRILIEMPAARLERHGLMQQLLLELAPPPPPTLDNFSPGKNGAALRALREALEEMGFQLDGQEFIALNGGPNFKFNESISFVVNCETQQEVDEYWNKLTDGGQEIACGWLKDRYGLAWQIVPTFVWEAMKRGDAAKTNRMMSAVMQMKKLDVAELQRAYEGK